MPRLFPWFVDTSIHCAVFVMAVVKTARVRGPLTNRDPSPRLSKRAKTRRLFAKQEGFPMAGKADVINAIAEQAGISKKEAGAAFDAFVGYITEACQSDVRCAIPGLGSFGVTHRKARE